MKTHAGARVATQSNAQDWASRDKTDQTNMKINPAKGATTNPAAMSGRNAQAIAVIANRQAHTKYQKLGGPDRKAKMSSTPVNAKYAAAAIRNFIPKLIKETDTTLRLKDQLERTTDHK